MGDDFSGVSNGDAHLRWAISALSLVKMVISDHNTTSFAM